MKADVTVGGRLATRAGQSCSQLPKCDCGHESLRITRESTHGQHRVISTARDNYLECRFVVEVIRRW